MKCIEKLMSKNLLRFGCAALAVMLAVGSVSFLRGFAAEDGAEEAAVSGSDIVSASDFVSGSDIFTETVEPKVLNADPVASGTCGTNVNWTLDSDGVLTISGSGAITNRYAYYDYRSNIRQVVVEDGVTAIPYSAYSSFPNLTSVSLGNSITSIGDLAFTGCQALTSVSFPASLTSIGNYAFMDCNQLSSVELPEGIQTLGIAAFCRTAVTSVTLPDSITSLKEGLFFGCAALTSVTLPKNLTAIPNNTFGQCSHLTALTIGYVISVHGNAFDSSYALETVYYPCGHDIESIQESFPNSPQFVPNHAMTKTDAVAATCIEGGNIDYWTCSVCNKIFSDEEGTTEITEADTVVAAAGHDFHDDDWATVTEATETTVGEEEHFCHRDGCGERKAREIPTRPDNYEFTADSLFTWTKGSTDGMVVIIKNVSPNGDDTQTFGKLVSVSVDGDAPAYTAESGSIILTLDTEFLETLAPGEHTLTVKLTFTTLTHTFTVVAPASTDTPATGESILLISVSPILVLLAAGGAAYVLIRRRRTAA